jgi:hypothetical protein
MIAHIFKNDYNGIMAVHKAMLAVASNLDFPEVP